MRRDLIDHRVELCDIFEKEISKWCRIRMRALDRGYVDLAQKIFTDIENARRDMSYDEYFNQYRYKFLFKI